MFAVGALENDFIIAPMRLNDDLPEIEDSIEGKREMIGTNFGRFFVADGDERNEFVADLDDGLAQEIRVKSNDAVVGVHGPHDPDATGIVKATEPLARV